jgi:hypothetical protein
MWARGLSGAARRRAREAAAAGRALACDSKKLAAVTRKEVEIIPKKMYL